MPGLEANILGTQMKWLETTTQLPKLESFVCRPGLMASRGEIQSDPDYSDQRIERFARGVVDSFKGQHEVRCVVVPS